MDVSSFSPLYLTDFSVQEPWDTSNADSNQPKLAPEHSLGSTIGEGVLEMAIYWAGGRQVLYAGDKRLKCGCIINGSPAQKPSMKTEQDQFDVNLL